MTAAASTLTQRRATLKKLMADPDATFDQYRGIINGATEKERASLARTLNVPHNTCINLPASPWRDAPISGVKYVTTSCGDPKK